MRTGLKLALAICAATVVAAGAHAQETIRIGALAGYSGIGATAGISLDQAIKLFVKENGDVFGGRKVEFIRRDTTGPNPDVVKRLVQELVFQQKVSLILGMDFTPNALAAAPVVTEGKVPTVMLGTATSGIVRQKSPYYVRLFMSIPQVTKPIAQWAAKSGLKKVYTVVADYAPGQEAEPVFADTFKAAGGSIVGSLRVPTRNPEFAPYMQRIRDAHPDAMFVFMPVGELGVGLIQAYGASGLSQTGIKMLGTGDITDEGYLDASGPASVGVITSFMYSYTHASQTNKDLIAKWEALNGRDPRIGISAVTAWDGLHLIRDGLEAQKGQKFDPDKFMAFARAWKYESPRGPISIDPDTQDIIQNMYIRRVERVNGDLQNIEFDTFPAVKG